MKDLIEWARYNMEIVEYELNQEYHDRRKAYEADENRKRFIECYQTALNLATSAVLYGAETNNLTN